MQSALRSAARRAVGISGRRGVAAAATTTKPASAAAAASEDWLAEHEKAWVKAMVQREVRAQMLEEEERRIMRDRLRAAAEEEWRARRLADELELWGDCYWACSAAMGGWLVGAWLAMLLVVVAR